MPHFIIECPRSIGDRVDFNELTKVLHDAGIASKLFSSSDIKSRIIPFDHYLVGGKDDDFVHITGYILSGRSGEQRKNLSRIIMQHVCDFLPDIQTVTVDIRDIDRNSYSNRKLLGL